MTAGGSERSAGRPRDARIDDRLLSVTRELLMEVGWDELSMRLVAARAGVGRSSLKRRWASKAELVLHAILGETPDMAPFSGTDLTGWIEWVVRGSRELFHRADVKAAVPGLMLALQENDTLRKALWADFSGPAVRLYTEHMRTADRDREANQRAELDARAVLAMAAGGALFMTTVAVDDDSDALQARIAELLTIAVDAGRTH